MDWKIELVFIPVSDIDRARDFYVNIGFVLDCDQQVEEGLRFVQLTPPGSACSIALGEGITEMTPGTQNSIQVVIPNADDALAHLNSQGVDAHGVDEQAWGASCASTIRTAIPGRFRNCLTIRKTRTLHRTDVLTSDGPPKRAIRG